MPTELESCPFCGSEAEQRSAPSMSGTIYTDRCRCTNMQCAGHKIWWPITEWNTRVFDRTPEREAAGEMRELLKEVVVGVDTDKFCTCYVCKAARVLATIAAAEAGEGGVRQYERPEEA